MPLQKYTFTATLTIRENLDNREGKQILHLETNDILLGLRCIRCYPKFQS